MGRLSQHGDPAMNLIATDIAASVSIPYACVRLLDGSAAQQVGVEEISTLDVLMLALGVGGFALLIGYVALCERL